MSTSADPARRIESLSAVGPSRRRVLGGTGAGLALAAGLPGVGGAADAADLPLLGTYDVVVIGSGAAGMTAALTAAKQGLSCVVVEKAATFGARRRGPARASGFRTTPSSSPRASPTPRRRPPPTSRRSSGPTSPPTGSAPSSATDPP
uniref:FAD-dependent oxidoreductase 2 FAD-binding domain-containing protein n=1 Tax=Streptomyces avermitilis TaxID=33903 RepID=A0A499V8V5_STRAX|nr:hypothetical protein SAVMC3_19090 [Streptomyces avermitilis]